ncbi:MAG: lasso peptide biosynthesis B2 protein [Polyangiaceae bacterium]
MEWLEKLETFTGPEGSHALRFGAMAWALAPVVELSLRSSGLKRTMDRIERLPMPSAPRAWAVEGALAERLVAWAFRLHVGLRGLCLERSLVEWAVHRLAGTRARLVIGVRKEEAATAKVAAHAWVEIGDDTRSRDDGYTTIFDGSDDRQA